MDKTIRREGGISVWRQVSDRLRELIDSGDIAAGDRMPSEADLALRFGINRHTVRAAIAELVGEGLLRAEQGRGTFVAASKRLSYPISTQTRFSSGLDGQARDVKTVLLDSKTEAASDTMAAALGLAPGTELIRLDTLGLADQTPLSVAAHWFEARRVPGIVDLLQATGSITAVLESLGLGDYIRQSTRITARRATMRDAQALRLVEWAPVLMVEAVNAQGGQPLQVSRTRFAANRIELLIGS